MILGYYIIDQHAVKRYKERIGNFKNLSTIDSIKRDLHFTRIKRIVHKEDEVIHVFTVHSKEFIFTKEKDKLVLKTVIKRNRQNNGRSINKRQRQKTELCSV
jgi:hypothetical protein